MPARNGGGAKKVPPLWKDRKETIVGEHNGKAEAPQVELTIRRPKGPT